jgi:diacylglycerol kinase
MAHDAEAYMNFLSQPSLNMMESAEPPAPRRRKSWVAKFKVAFRGIKLGVRGHSSFFVHFFFTALVIMAAVVLHCDVIDWCILLGCIGFVLTAELFNSTLETLFRGLDEATRERTWPCLDIAAGAVLVASITSAIVGSLVFIHRLVIVYGL